MKIQNGLKPIQVDHRDYDFHRTFGAISSSLDLPLEYNCDAGLSMPDQNADGLPYGCSGYTQSELCQDEDLIKYKASYTYDKTRMMEGTYPQAVGCDIRNSLQSTIDYGVQGEMEINDTQAFQHHRGQYFNVQPINGSWFDGIRSALWVNRLERRSVSTGTPWWPSWETIDASALIPMPGNLDPDMSGAAWHNWKLCGWKIIGGYVYLIGKSWQGAGYGDKGYCYISREVIEQVMKVKGSAAFTIGKATPADIQSIKISILQLIISYMRRLLNLQ